MSFGARPIFSFTLPLNLKLRFKKCLTAFLPGRHNHLTKLLIPLFCSNVLLAGANHVICIELSDAGITKTHFQHYECMYPQRGGALAFQQQKENASRIQTSNMPGTQQSNHQCIDEHIQFKKILNTIDFSKAILLATIQPEIQDTISQTLRTSGTSFVPLEYSIPLSSYRSSVTRNIVMLI